MSSFINMTPNKFRQAVRQEQLEARTRTTVKQLKEHVLVLEDELERTNLLVRTLFELISTYHGVTEKQFKDMMELIDLKDGVIDGKVRSTNILNAECQLCHRKVSRRFKHCVYCGGELSVPQDPFAMRRTNK